MNRNPVNVYFVGYNIKMEISVPDKSAVNYPGIPPMNPESYPAKLETISEFRTTQFCIECRVLFRQGIPEYKVLLMELNSYLKLRHPGKEIEIVSCGYIGEG